MLPCSNSGLVCQWEQERITQDQSTEIIQLSVAKYNIDIWEDMSILKMFDHSCPVIACYWMQSNERNCNICKILFHHGVLLVRSLLVVNLEKKEFGNLQILQSGSLWKDQTGQHLTEASDLRQSQVHNLIVCTEEQLPLMMRRNRCKHKALLWCVSLVQKHSTCTRYSNTGWNHNNILFCENRKKYKHARIPPKPPFTESSISNQQAVHGDLS